MEDQPVNNIPKNPVDKNQGKFKALVLVLIVSLCAAALLMIFLLLRGGNETANQPMQISGDKKILSLGEKLASQDKIKRFENYDELSNYLEENAGNNPTRDTGLRKEMLNVTLANPVAEMVSFEDSAGAQDYSQTNVQVAGVDEADIIKTDGKYIYAVGDKKIAIIEAYPKDSMHVVSYVDLPARPEDIYVNGNSLAVFGTDDSVKNVGLFKEFRRNSGYAFFRVYDIANKTNPLLKRDLHFEGKYSNSRMIGDYVYFLTSSPAVYSYDELPIPRIVQDKRTVLNDPKTPNPCLPSVYYFEITGGSRSFMNVAAINVRNHDEQLADEVYMLADNQNMYVSKDNIYITYTKRVSESELSYDVLREMLAPRLSPKELKRVQEIEEAPRTLLSETEKMNKIQGIFQRYVESRSDEEQLRFEAELKEKMKKKYADISKELEKTVVHKIAINKNILEYKNFGQVPGSVLNQFSMDEDKGYFRIATTKNRSWSMFFDEGEIQQKSYNNLYVLDENLKVVGAVENLAPDEQIHSVRFMQGRAYVVTFRQVDPLFVIDLKNPRTPRVLGQLKVTGYSDYLHPYDETTLIGLGRETENNGYGGVINRGIKLSLFDVSDVHSPKELAKYELGERGSDSIALDDHKAFLFSKDKNLLVIPVTVVENSNAARSNEKIFTISGAAVFNVDKSGFSLKGMIDHSDKGKPGIREYWWESYGYYDNMVKRSLYIEDTLFTFSSKYLFANNLGDLKLIQKIKLQ